MSTVGSATLFPIPHLDIAYPPVKVPWLKFDVAELLAVFGKKSHTSFCKHIHKRSSFKYSESNI